MPASMLRATRETTTCQCNRTTITEAGQLSLSRFSYISCPKSAVAETVKAGQRSIIQHVRPIVTRENSLRAVHTHTHVKMLDGERANPFIRRTEDYIVLSVDH